MRGGNAPHEGVNQFGVGIGQAECGGQVHGLRPQHATRECQAAEVDDTSHVRQICAEVAHGATIACSMVPRRSISIRTTSPG